MATSSESEEDEIWNYKCHKKEKSTVSKGPEVQESYVTSTSTKLRRRSSLVPARQSAGTTQCKIPTAAQILDTGQSVVGVAHLASSHLEAESSVHVIDLDLEDEAEFAPVLAAGSLTGVARKPLLSHSTSRGCSTNTGSKSAVKKSNAKKKITNTNTGSKSVVKKSTANKKITSPNTGSKKDTSNSNKSKKESTALGVKKTDSTECNSLHSFLTVANGQVRKKRKSSESVDKLFFYEDLEIVEQETNTGKSLIINTNNGLVVEDLCTKIVLCKDTVTNASEYDGVKTEGKTTMVNYKYSGVSNFDSIPNHHEEAGGRKTSEEVKDSQGLKCANDILNTQFLDSESPGDLEKCDLDGGGFCIEEEVSDLEDCDWNGKTKVEKDCEWKGMSLVVEASCEDTAEQQALESYVVSKADYIIPTKSMTSPTCPANHIIPTKSMSVPTSSVTAGASPSHALSSVPTLKWSPQSPDKTLASSSTQKQTSLYSFFKAKAELGSRVTTSVKSMSVSSSSSTRGKPGCNRGGANRPDLPCSKTVPGTTSPALSVPSSGRPGVRKSVSEADSGRQTEADMSQPADNKGRPKKQCPFYKKIPNTGITVDAFSYGVIPGCEAYILTHFHYDHYGGLTKKFAQPIYCSPVTGNLVEKQLGVHEKWIHRLPLWIPQQVAGVTVTLMEANHCPGAIMLLFEFKDGRRILHTGDFRASLDMENYAMLRGISVSELYLDTTYCNPSYAFPTQGEVINFVVTLVLNTLAENPKTLIVCGTYTIGKEKIFTAVAKVLDCPISVTRDKKKVLDCLEDKDLKSRLTLDWTAGRVHVLPMAKLKQKELLDHCARYPQFKNVLAFEPTGWTHNNNTSLESLKPKWSKSGVTLYGVPYSEHSSYLELKRFVQFLRPRKILPTVNNGNPASRKKMEDSFAEWMREKPACSTDSGT